MQITDCHLATDRSFELGGVPVWPRFASVLDDIRCRCQRVDLLVFTGDIAHDEQPTTYQAVAEALSHLMVPYWLLPGNHDQRTWLATCAPAACSLSDHRLVYRRVWAPWQLIGLDTLDPGQDSGRLGEPQLQWLENHLLGHRTASGNQRSGPSGLLMPTTALGQVTSAPETSRPPLDNAKGEAAPSSLVSNHLSSDSHPDPLWTVLFLHHPPTQVQCTWLDSIGLVDQQELLNLVRRHPQVRIIIGGHVHQETTAAVDATIVLTTPAVGPQFRPRAPTVTMEVGPPKYRILELYPDGRWFTQVWQVNPAQ